MLKIKQTVFGYPTGNCFNTAIACIFELDKIPTIDPALPNDEWIRQWCLFFDNLGMKWESRTLEPEKNNWDAEFIGYSIAHVEIIPGILHAIVCCDGLPVWDVGGNFHTLCKEDQRRYRIISWSWFTELKEGEKNSFEGCPHTDFVEASLPRSYIIPTKTCEKCGNEFDWLFGVCPKCYPNGYVDAIREITGSKK